MAHFTGTGPAGATVSVYVPGTETLARVFSDVGLTVSGHNPFTMVGTTYDFYAAAAYVAFGVGPSKYVDSDLESFDEYSAPAVAPPIRKASDNTTGAGSAALGANSPAITNTAPYTWIKMTSADGSTVFIPAWK